MHLSEGRVLAAWFGGTYEGLEDTAIYAALRFSHGNWSEPLVAAKVWIASRDTLAWPHAHAHNSQSVGWVGEFPLAGGAMDMPERVVPPPQGP